jgi:hypothetical protein
MSDSRNGEDPLLKLRFFTRPNCHLCLSALSVVHRVRAKIPFELELINIDQQPEYVKDYGDVIPVITCDGKEIARSFVEEKKLAESLRETEG